MMYVMSFLCLLAFHTFLLNVLSCSQMILLTPFIFLCYAFLNFYQFTIVILYEMRSMPGIPQAAVVWFTRPQNSGFRNNMKMDIAALIPLGIWWKWLSFRHQFSHVTNVYLTYKKLPLITSAKKWRHNSLQLSRRLIGESFHYISRWMNCYKRVYDVWQEK